MPRPARRWCALPIAAPCDRVASRSLTRTGVRSVKVRHLVDEWPTLFVLVQWPRVEATILGTGQAVNLRRYRCTVPRQRRLTTIEQPVLYWAGLPCTA